MLQSGQVPDEAGQVAATSLNALLKKSKKPAVRGQSCGSCRLHAVSSRCSTCKRCSSHTSPASRRSE